MSELLTMNSPRDPETGGTEMLLRPGDQIGSPGDRGTALWPVTSRKEARA